VGEAPMRGAIPRPRDELAAEHSPKGDAT
jgi:hypothetical protein